MFSKLIIAALFISGIAHADHAGRKLLEYTAPQGCGTICTATCGAGTITTVGNYKYCKLTASDTWTVTSGSCPVESELFGGGGGGGGASAYAGGGGAGGGYLHTLTTATGNCVTAIVGSYSVVIGAGAPGNGFNTPGANGGNTTFNGLTALGGGTANGNAAGSNGGSGGGGSGGGSGTPGGSSLSGQGFAGGAGDASASQAGGGGGGAGSIGIAGVGGTGQGGQGGSGLTAAIDGNTYGCGAGAGGLLGGAGAGCLGGGAGNGDNRGNPASGTDATANNASGGGGGVNGHHGSDGVALIKWKFQ